MRLLWVTGASGFVGRYVARRFADAGWSVAGLGRRAWGAEERERWGVGAWIESDVDRVALDGLAAEAGLPHCVFHAAGGASVGRSIEAPHDDHEDSVSTTSCVLGYLRRHVPDAAFILPSSAAVYGAAPPGPIVEDAPLRPVSPYGRHKRMAEDLCEAASRESGLNITVIRYFSVYGPELRKQLLWDLAQKALLTDGPVELFGTGEETRDMLHAADAASLALCAAKQVGPGLTVINGGSGVATPVREIAETLVGCLGLQAALRFNGEAREGDPKHFQADIGRARALGFDPEHTLADGLAEYADWVRHAIGGPRC